MELCGETRLRPLNSSGSFGKPCPRGAIDRYVVPMAKAQRGCKLMQPGQLHRFPVRIRPGGLFLQPAQDFFSALWFSIINIWKELKGSCGRKARSEV